MATNANANTGAGPDADADADTPNPTERDCGVCGRPLEEPAESQTVCYVCMGRRSPGDKWVDYYGEKWHADSECDDLGKSRWSVAETIRPACETCVGGDAAPAETDGADENQDEDEDENEDDGKCDQIDCELDAHDRVVVTEGEDSREVAMCGYHLLDTVTRTDLEVSAVHGGEPDDGE